MENPTYWAVIPANVRYSKLKANAKLLFGEISALSNREGYCWASNKYFADLYGVSKNTISLWINQLKEFGFVNVEVIRDQNKQVIKRKICIIINDDRSQDQEKEGIIKNGEVNKINNNKTNNNIIQRKEKFEMEVYEENILCETDYKKFVDYWCETNRSQTKMRFEMEKTWNTRKRLQRWKNMKFKYQPVQSNKISNAHNEWMKAKEFIKRNT